MKNLMTVIIVIVAITLVVSVFIFFGGSKSDIRSDLTTSSTNIPSTEVLSQELLLALSSLKDLELDNNFFKDRVFLSLIDYSKDLKDELLGRDNPFLPVEQ